MKGQFGAFIPAIKSYDSSKEGSKYVYDVYLGSTCVFNTNKSTPQPTGQTNTKTKGRQNSIYLLLKQESQIRNPSLGGNTWLNERHISILIILTKTGTVL